MSEYIEVDAFKKEMYHEAFETDTDMQRWDSGCWIRYKLFEEILKKQQTADVRPNVHGEWVGTEYDGYANGYPVFYEWECSACGCTIEDEEPTWNFCPNCGASMLKGEKDG